VTAHRSALLGGSVPEQRSGACCCECGGAARRFCSNLRKPCRHTRPLRAVQQEHRATAHGASCGLCAHMGPHGGQPLRWRGAQVDSACMGPHGATTALERL